MRRTQLFRHPRRGKLNIVWPALVLPLLLSACGSDGKDGKDGIDGSSSGPVIANISVIGVPIYPGGQVQFQVSASSPGGAPLTYDWDIPQGWIGTDSGDSTLVLTAPKEQAVGDTVTVTVDDGQQSRSGSVLVATRGPAIESFEVDYTPPLAPGDNVTFTLDAYNRDGNVLTNHFSIGGARLASVSDAQWQWQATPQALSGYYQLAGTVEDSSGLTASAGITVELGGGSAWPAFGGDRQRSGRNRESGAMGAVGNKVWEYNLASSVVSSPAIDENGVLYVGASGGGLYFINPDGTVTMALFGTAGNKVSSSPAVGADGTIYFCAEDGSIYAVYPGGSSNAKWWVKTAGKVQSSPAIGADGTIYVGSGDNHLYALNPNGSVKWRFETGDEVYSSPALAADGTIYVGSFDSYLYALNPDGSQKWRFNIPGEVYSSPAVGADGTIYVGSVGKRVYALTPDGNEKWHFETDGAVLSSPAVAVDGTVYVGSHDEHIYALNADGSEKWRYKTGGIVSSSPVLSADGTVYVGSWDTYVYALNPAGSLQWRFKTGAAVSSSPAIGADGTVYVGSTDGRLYAIE